VLVIYYNNITVRVPLGKITFLKIKVDSLINITIYSASAWENYNLIKLQKIFKIGTF